MLLFDFLSKSFFNTDCTVCAWLTWFEVFLNCVFWRCLFRFVLRTNPLPAYFYESHRVVLCYTNLLSVYSYDNERADHTLHTAVIIVKLPCIPIKPNFDEMSTFFSILIFHIRIARNSKVSFRCIEIQVLRSVDRIVSTVACITVYHVHMLKSPIPFITGQHIKFVWSYVFGQ